MLDMTPMIAWMQAGTLMIIGLQALMLPPAALPTLPTIEKASTQR
jgi:hypothetical protein